MSNNLSWKEAALSGRVVAPGKARVPIGDRVQPIAEKSLKIAVLVLFTVGLLAAGVLGTETRLLFYWPGATLMALGAVAATLKWRWRVASPPSEVCLGAALLFAAYFAGRAMTSPVVSWAREDFFILLGCGVAYLTTTIALSHPRWRHAVLVVLVLLVMGNIAVGCIHFSGQWTFHVVPHYMREMGYAGRIRGFFINPNHLAALLAAMSLLFVGQALFGRFGATWKLLLLFLAIASAIGVALTKSRGGIVGLGAGGLTLAVIGLILLRRTMPHLFVKAAMGILLFGGLAALVLWGVISTQMEQRFREGTLPSAGEDPRTIIWTSAWVQHLEHPWLGAGARMFYEGGIRLRPMEMPPWSKDPMFAHNDWLQALADYGWLGLALLAFMLVVHLGNGWRYLSWFASEKFQRSASLSGRRLGWVVGCMAALAALLTHAVFEFHFHVPAVALTAAVMMGVLANPGFERGSHPSRRVPGVRALSKVALGACGLGLICGAWRTGQADYLVEQAMILPADADATARIDFLSDAVRADPDNDAAWHERALAEISAAGGKSMHEAAPLLNAAVSDLEQSLLLNPFNGYPALALADVYDVLGRHEDAEKLILQAVQTMPLHVTPRLALARHFHRLRRWMEADEAYMWACEGRAWTPENPYNAYMGMLRDAEK